MIIFILLFIVLVAFITYHIIRVKTKEVRYISGIVLRDTQDKIDLLPDFWSEYDTISIDTKETYFFGKKTKSERIISTGYYDDSDYDDYL